MLTDKSAGALYACLLTGQRERERERKREIEREIEKERERDV